MTVTNTILYFLLLSIFFAHFAFTNDEYDILLVVGDVNVSSARVLYEDVTTGKESTLHSKEIKASLYNYHTKSLLEEKKLVLQNYPQVVQFSNLSQNQKYLVQFGDRNAYNNYVTFTTFKMESKNSNFPIIFLSCNRFAEDQSDTYMWEQLYIRNFQSTIEKDQHYFQNFDNTHDNQIMKEDESEIRAIFHTGDQIYGDNIYGEIIEAQKNGKCITYFDILDKFRQYYKTTWKSNPFTRLILKHTSNVMLPDDHDIVNNLNNNTWNLKIVKHPNTKLIFKMLIRAGAQAYLEYQYQLSQDLPTKFQYFEEKIIYPCCITFDNETQNSCPLEWDEFDNALTGEQKPILFRSFLIQNTGFILLDTRFESAFTNENDATATQFIGRKQQLLLKDRLSDWENSQEIDHILLITSVPLLFQSELMSILAEFVENEKYSTHKDSIRDTTEIFDTIFEGTAYQKLLLISGDLHMYFDSDICSSNGKCVKQIISSGLSKKSSAVDSFHLVAYFFACMYLSIAKITSNISDILYSIKFNTVFLSNNYLLLTINGTEISWNPYLRPIEGIQENTRIFLFTHFFDLLIALGLFVVVLVIAKLKIRKKRKTS